MLVGLWCAMCGEVRRSFQMNFPSGGRGGCCSAGLGFVELGRLRFGSASAGDEIRA